MQKSSAKSSLCRLCQSSATEIFHKSQQRDYHLCSDCQLVFADPGSYLSPIEEKAEYDRHENSVDDPRYRLFLMQMFRPMQALIPVHSKGLDFGCGPGPALSRMFSEAGHTMALYDYFYAQDSKVLNDQYDFITATELIEHLHQPGQVLNRLWMQLKPHGYLGLMTQLWDEQDSFAGWAYKNDATHVCFFSNRTFAWLAKHWQARWHRIDRNVSIFEKTIQADYPSLNPR